MVNEDGTFCNGASGTRFSLVSKRADGSWRNMLASEGVAEFLQGRGKDGWPDVSIGGPGFCFPVMRWNGVEYAFDRNEYEGRRCTRDRRAPERKGRPGGGLCCAAGSVRARRRGALP